MQADNTIMSRPSDLLPMTLAFEQSFLYNFRKQFQVILGGTMKKLLLLIIMVSLIFTGCKRRGEEEPRAITPKSEVLTEPEKEKMYQAGVKAYNENNYRAARQYFYSIWQNDKSYQSVTDYYFNSSYAI